MTPPGSHAWRFFHWNNSNHVWVVTSMRLTEDECRWMGGTVSCRRLAPECDSESLPSPTASKRMSHRGNSLECNSESAKFERFMKKRKKKECFSFHLLDLWLTVTHSCKNRLWSISAGCYDVLESFSLKIFTAKWLWNFHNMSNDRWRV